MKSATRAILAYYPVRLTVRLLIVLLESFGRFVSLARLKAIAPHAIDTVCHWSVELKYPERVSFGRRVIIGPNCTIGAAGGIEIGDYVRLSKGVLVETAGLDFNVKPHYPHVTKAIQLERGVWIGAGAMILGGVTIGEGSIVGAGAVVTRDVPPFTVVTGPSTRMRARVRGEWFEN